MLGMSNPPGKLSFRSLCTERGTSMSRIVLTALAFAAGFAAHAGFGIATAQQQIVARTILQTEVKGGVFEEAVAQVYEFPPGAVLPWHIHPDAQEIAYILDGALTLEIEGQGARVYTAGEATYVPPNAVHRGLADEKLGTKLVAVRFKPKAQPLVTLMPR
jgi:quercetin dioxygenase-like cupin family protein